jgi:hypothetical protein
VRRPSADQKGDEGDDSRQGFVEDTNIKKGPRVEISQHNVIYNVPHPSLLLFIRDKTTRNALLFSTQEIKQDIVYQRMILPEPSSISEASDKPTKAGSSP